MKAILLAAVVILPLFATAEEPVETESIELFDGKTLAGWDAFTGRDDVKLADVWSVADGVIKCVGRPSGVLHTKAEYENYTLEVEWRWPGRGGNSGVLVHATTPRERNVWPKSLEVQLQSQQAGDFWVIGTTIKLPPEDGEPADRIKGRRHINLTDDSEKELGEWNTLRVECKADTIKVWVNDTMVNRASEVSQTKGQICLQSEGTPIEFRRVTLTPIVED